MSGFGEIGWSILETFAKVTRACEEIQETVLSHPVAQQILPLANPSSSRDAVWSRTLVSPDSRSRTTSQSQGLDELTHLYLTRWAAGIVERASTELSMRFNLGLARQYAPFDLLGSGQSTPFSEGPIDTEQDPSRGPSVELICMSREPLTPVEWISYYTRTDSLQALTESQLHPNIQVEPAVIYKRIHSGGIDPDLRPEVWKYLLGIYFWDSTEEERKALDAANCENYWRLKQRWMDPEVRKSDDYKEQQFRIGAAAVEKDVLRTDRHVPLFSSPPGEPSGALPSSSAALEQLKDILMCYHFFNRELGYVQGMSDLLSRCTRFQGNFSRDQKPMHHQLQTLSLLIKLVAPTLHSHLVAIGADNMFSCFRWVLIWFKREFSFDHIPFLWEVFWSDYHTKHFHLFVAAAILEIHQHVIVTHLRGLDEILKVTHLPEFESAMRAHAEDLNHVHPEVTAPSDDPCTPLVVTPPPEVHSYTVSPSSPPFDPAVPTLTPEEFNALKFLLERDSPS
ncbi:GTPase activating protein [Massospora cicadina]|nr:GTPase activating protein [Massospora cicadina]